MRIPAVPYVLFRTLGELAALPLHLACFVVRRGRIKVEIRRILEQSAEARRRVRPDHAR